MTSDPRESQPLAADDAHAKRIVYEADDAIRRHQDSLENVKLQLTFRRSFIRPWLMPCCNFPYCNCRDTKKYKYKIK